MSKKPNHSRAHFDFKTVDFFDADNCEMRGITEKKFDAEGMIQSGAIPPSWMNLFNKINSTKTIAPIGREFIPEEVLSGMDKMIGPCDSFIAVHADWLLGDPRHVIVYAKGSSRYDALIGKTKAECLEWASDPSNYT